jgi:hypothetical protein
MLRNHVTHSNNELADDDVGANVPDLPSLQHIALRELA